MSMPSSVARTPNRARLAGGVGDLGRVQQRLGRDAAAVQAGAPEQVLLDEGDGQPQLGGAQRAGVAAAASPEDDDVDGWSRRWPASRAAPLLWRVVARRRRGGAVRTLPSILSLPTELRHTPRAHTGDGRRPSSTARGPRPIVSAWRGGDAVRAKRAPHGGGDLASRDRRHLRGLRRDPARGRGLRRAGHQRHGDDGGADRPRRRVDPAGRCPRARAFEVARTLGIPVYDVNLTGYPARMREWTSRQRRPRGADPHPPPPPADAPVRRGNRVEQDALRLRG